MGRAMEKFYAEGITEITIQYLKGLINDFGFTVSQAMAMLKIPESEQKKYEELLKKS